MSKIKHYVDYAEAYMKALEQASNHAQQVSGVWSISGKEFCKLYGLDYDHARDIETEVDHKAMNDECMLEWGRIIRKLGFELTDEQHEQFEDKFANEWCYAEEEEVFWEDIMKQLVNAYPDYAERYTERNIRDEYVDTRAV